MKNGVFLARFQPLHVAHMWLIEQALKENDTVLVILGSANKNGMVRNPFPLETRKYWLKESLKNKKDFDRIKIIELPDWSKEDDKENAKEWGTYLYMNIVSQICSKTFSIYYSDDISIIRNWFEDKYLEKINIRNFERNNLFDGLSATKLRQAFIDNNKDYIKKYCPDVILQEFDTIKKIIEDVNKNPKEDFIMR